MTAMQTWANLLTAHIASARTHFPTPGREALSALEEQQCRILGGHLISWLSDRGPRLLCERNALPVLRGDTPSPLIVFVTDTPGLVAAREILGPNDERVVPCLRTELESFLERAHDDQFKVHVELHSYFEGVHDAEMEKQLRRKYKIERGGELLTHYDCSVLGERFARGGRHLWRWDGEELRLVEEGMESWVS